jgi:hypothetical protein
MAVTMSLYNHAPKLLANKEVNFTNLRVKLLSSSASFTASHTSIEQVDNGAKSTVTITIASPGVVSWNSHGYSNGQPILLNTTGALPTGLSPGVTYYIVNASTNSFQLAATAGGSAINTSGSQSGTHTAFASGSYEVSGNGWAAGGPTLANVAVTTVTTNDAMLDADDVTVTASGGSIGPASALTVYDGLTGKPIIYMDFGQSQSAGDTTDFKVVWNSGGLIAFAY